MDSQTGLFLVLLLLGIIYMTQLFMFHQKHFNRASETEKGSSSPTTTGTLDTIPSVAVDPNQPFSVLTLLKFSGSTQSRHDAIPISLSSAMSLDQVLARIDDLASRVTSIEVIKPDRNSITKSGYLKYINRGDVCITWGTANKEMHTRLDLLDRQGWLDCLHKLEERRGKDDHILAMVATRTL